MGVSLLRFSFEKKNNLVKSVTFSIFLSESRIDSEDTNFGDIESLAAYAVGYRVRCLNCDLYDFCDLQDYRRFWLGSRSAMITETSLGFLIIKLIFKTPIQQVHLFENLI